LMASPLICGNDLRAMNEITQATLMNPEIIAINQDKLGKQATVLRKENDVQIIIKQLENKSWAVGLFNRNGEASQSASISFNELGFPSVVQVRDVWAHKNIKTDKKTLVQKVLPHQCKVFLIKSVK
jgi:alpha-galactosidase